jgi:hypothetical protein
LLAKRGDEVAPVSQPSCKASLVKVVQHFPKQRLSKTGLVYKGCHVGTFDARRVNSVERYASNIAWVAWQPVDHPRIHHIAITQHESLPFIHTARDCSWRERLPDRSMTPKH